jgi:hypothetical protein
MLEPLFYGELNVTFSLIYNFFERKRGGAVSILVDIKLENSDKVT